MIRRLINKILTVTDRKIVQCSPQRSNSTLIFNILQSLFFNVKKEIKKFKTLVNLMSSYNFVVIIFLNIWEVQILIRNSLTQTKSRY